MKVKLSRGKEREIQHMMTTSFWDSDGKPITAEQFLNNLFGELPKLFKDEVELRRIWSYPKTRQDLLMKLDAAGFPKSDLVTLQKLVELENSDLYDVLEYVFNGDYEPITREARVKAAESSIFNFLDSKQREFIKFVLTKYIETGVDELSQEKLPALLEIKYRSISDALKELGDADKLFTLFSDFQVHLYKQAVA